jgi:N-acetylmuramoyl-L-alanine amidase
VSKDWVPYVVQQGDHLAKLAFAHGTDPDTVWGHPKNKDVVARRAERDTLAPGDVLYLPGEPPPALALSEGTSNSYRATVPKVTIKMRLAGSSRPVAGKAFEVHGAGNKPVTGTTSGDGAVSFEVPVFVREVELRVPDAGIALSVRIGDLDPIEERSGVVQRLRNLGLVGAGAVSDEQLAQGLRAFQREHGLKTTGDVDDATRSALKSAHRV